MSKDFAVRAPLVTSRGANRSPASSTSVVSLFARAKERNDELRSHSHRSTEPAVPSKPLIPRRPVPWPMAKKPTSDNKKTVDTASATAPQPPAGNQHPLRTIGVMVTGGAGLDVEAFLEGILGVCDSRNITPVFITDLEDFSRFRERGLYFEHIPSQDAIRRFGQGRDWQLYMDRRLGILQDKWGLDGFVAFGNEDGATFESLATEVSDLGFWRRQIVRLFRIAMDRTPRNMSTEGSNADSQVSRSSY